LLANYHYCAFFSLEDMNGSLPPFSQGMIEECTGTIDGIVIIQVHSSPLISAQQETHSQKTRRRTISSKATMRKSPMLMVINTNQIFSAYIMAAVISNIQRNTFWQMELLPSMLLVGIAVLVL
jgi:hypothetical protein